MRGSWWKGGLILLGAAAVAAVLAVTATPDSPAALFGEADVPSHPSKPAEVV